MPDDDATPAQPETHEPPAAPTEPTDLEAEMQAPEPAQQAEDPEDRAEDQRVKAARSEARNLRSRLRDTEAERDTLGSRLEGWQRAEATRIAADRANLREWSLVDGADLWRSGVELADLLDDAGAVDEGKVAEAVGKIAKGHPHWCYHQSRAMPSGFQPGSSGPPSSGGWLALTV